MHWHMGHMETVKHTHFCYIKRRAPMPVGRRVLVEISIYGVVIHR